MESNDTASAEEPTVAGPHTPRITPVIFQDRRLPHPMHRRRERRERRSERETAPTETVGDSEVSAQSATANPSTDPPETQGNKENQEKTLTTQNGEIVPTASYYPRRSLVDARCRTHSVSKTSLLEDDIEKLSFERDLFRLAAKDNLSGQRQREDEDEDLSRTATNLRAEYYLKKSSKLNAQVKKKKQEAFILSNIQDAQGEYISLRLIQSHVQRGKSDVEAMKKIFDDNSLSSDSLGKNIDDFEDLLQTLDDDRADIKTSNLLSKGTLNMNYSDESDDEPLEFRIENCPEIHRLNKF